MAEEGNFVFPENVTKVLINFGEICRFCLRETQNDICIRDKCLPEGQPELEQDTIYDFVTKFKIIKMNNAESFPSQVCKNCYNVIKICYNFIKVCQKSETLLNGCHEKVLKEAKQKFKSLNGGTTKLPDEHFEVINAEPDCQTEEVVGISKSTEVEVKNKIVLISKQVKELSEKIKSRGFTSPVSLAPANENYFCPHCSLKFCNQKALNHHCFCMHGEKCKKILFEQGNITTHIKTTGDKQISGQSKEDINNLENLVQIGVKSIFCFYCTPCKEFQTREDFIEHMKYHEVKDCNDCSYCEDKFPSKLNLSQHLIDLHNLTTDTVSLEDEFIKQGPTDMNIKEYDKMTHSVTDFLDLCQVKGRNVELHCKKCNPSMDFSTTNDFIKHMTSHHSSSKLIENLAVETKAGIKSSLKWKCCDCSATYSQKQSLFCHMRQKHNKQYPESMRCPICSERFLTNRKLIQHGIIAHQKYFANFHKIFTKIMQPPHEEVIQSKNFQCNMCQKKYIFKTSLKKHIFSVHLEEPKDSVICPYCGKTLANKLNLKSHIEFKHEALFVSCPICKKKINFRTIGRHYKVHQNSAEGGIKNSYLCTQCGKILKSKRSFEDHQKIHKNIRNELCDVCGSGYATKKALRLHKKTHEGTQRKLHECDQCDKVFNGRHTLNRHLLTHSGVKNFICEICSKCFYTLQELNRHVRYHKKEHRFECKQCNMRFVDKSRFRHHLMKHKNIRPHKCQYCEKMFIVRGKLNLHMASKHNVRVDNRRVWKDPKAYIPLSELL